MGWLWRVSQRFVLRSWWKRSRNMPWPAFVAQDAWPNWILGSRDAKVMGRLFGALIANFKIGVQAAFNTAVILGPASALWIFAWYDGWNNSFNKGYEQAVVGPALGFTGVLLFIAAMFYLPLAQMRHAATGDWRTFYQFHVVWKLIRRKWLECLGLAMLISALSLPLMILKTAPGLLTGMKPDKTEVLPNGFRRMVGSDLENLSPAQALQWLKRYYALCGVYLLPALLLMRLAAARVYASAVVDCIQSGALPQDALAENEWQALNRLDLLIVRPPRQRSRFVRTIAWVGTKAGAVTIGFAMFWIYFTFVAQVYVGEFLHKNDRAKGWWNQPLVELPYFNYIPARLLSPEQ